MIGIGILIVSPQAPCHTHVAHSARVENVKWALDDSRVITVGGSDGSVVQWKVGVPDKSINA